MRSGHMLKKLDSHFLTEIGKVFAKDVVEEDRWQTSYYAEHNNKNIIFTVSHWQDNSWRWSLDYK